MIVLTALAAGFATLLLLPVVSDVVSLLRSRRGPPPVRADMAEPGLVLLIPAHDEELLLGGCLESIGQLDYPADRLRVVVVADNCSDGTADVARRYGMRVLERHDDTHRGKPWAIAWAVERVDLTGMDAVVVVDADTALDRGFARGLAHEAPLNDKVVQPFNDVHNRSENSLTRMAAVQSMALHGLAFALKRRAGLTVPLSVGMCLGTDVIARRGWTAFSVCEDWEMYALLTVEGETITTAPRARIFAQEARSLRQGASQRTRWMAGKIQVMRERLGPLLRSRHITLHQKLDTTGELVVTGYGPVLLLGLTAALAAGLVLLTPPGYPWLLAALGLSLVRPVIYTVAAVAVDPAPGRAALAFLFLPPYAVWRITVMVTGLIGARPGAWIRTGRHRASAGG